MNSDPAPADSGWRTFLASLNARSVAVAIGLAVLAAAALGPIFIVPFIVLLARTLFLAMVLLLVYAGARQWPPRWLPGWLPDWLVPVAAVALASPLATLCVYLLSVGGDFAAFYGEPVRITGFLLIAGTGLVLGLLLTVGAMVRERLAKAQSQALQFELERSRLEKQAVDARLALLQAQIEPHFLFNTLANVQALVETQSPRAGPVLQSLIAYLRAAMPRLQHGDATLGNEVALVRAYLELMQMRMPDRLEFSVDVAPALAMRRFPGMALLTLVENAVRHGVDPSEDGGRIDIGASEDGGALRVWVADTGVGLDASAPAGTGLSNLHARLAAFYGPAAHLTLEENAPRGVRAQIVIPD